MEAAMVAHKVPYQVEIGAGKHHFWSGCGRSRNQPFCDGSHKGTGFNPHQFKAEESTAFWLCGCKRIGNRPQCDGTLKTL